MYGPARKTSKFLLVSVLSVMLVLSSTQSLLVPLLNVLLPGMQLLPSAYAAGSTIEVSRPTYLTNTTAHERNPSITHDGTYWWLFYSKSDSKSSNDTTICYRKSTTIEGLATALEYAVNATHKKENVSSAIYFKSKLTSTKMLHVFVSNTTQPWKIYYYTGTAGLWSNRNPLNVTPGGEAIEGWNVNAVCDSNRVYLVYENSSGIVCRTWDGETTKSTVIASGHKQPKITLKSGFLEVVAISSDGGQIRHFRAEAKDLPSFIMVSAAMTGTRLDNPSIFHDGASLYVVATWNSSDNNRRWLKQTKYSGLGWSDPKNVSYGGYGTKSWWEYSPVGNYTGGNLNLFFTTESDGDGEIAFVRMNWDLANDHYFYIKNAVDQAVSGDMVNVGAGTYREQVVITKSLTLQGQGASTVVKPDTLEIIGKGWYGSGYSKNIAGMIVVNTAAGSNVVVKNLKVDGSLITSKPNTADFLAGIFYNKTGGMIDTVTVTNIRIDTATPGYGIYISNSSDPCTVEIKSCTITEYGRTGIGVYGPKLTVNAHDNTITGRGPLPSGDEAQIGIIVQDCATGTLERNTVSNHIFTPETRWAAGIVFNFSSGTASGNRVLNCQIGIKFDNSNGSASSNTISGSDTYGVAAKTDTGVSLNVIIESNDLNGGSGTGIFIDGSSGSVDATIKNNLVSSWKHGINIQGSGAEATITGNTIQNNLGEGSGIHISGVTPTDIRIHYNNIFGNTGTYGAVWGVYSEVDGVDATYNWWGSASGPYNSACDLTGAGDTVSCTVIVYPWLGAPTYTMTVSYSILYGGIGYSPPIFDYTQGGSDKQYVLTLTPTDILVDKDSTWNVTNPLGGSTVNEQWITTQPTSGTVTSSRTIVFTYRHQYNLTINSAHGTASGGGWRVVED
ncbi:right-handed parallel beta-helix repeat-containing protein, partial [Candidatus Bathyarchaeota archaeon]|nr:right-handed parallel beta-helix repeat-containing protein [Candidatus Bathyarchaeota archaeon]